MSAEVDRTRVLVVEDEQNLADLYQAWLGKEYDVQTVYSGKAALEHMANNGADVVLLDRRMPGLSGDEVAHQIDQTEDNVQVIMITAVSPSVDMATLPIDDYVMKPLDREQSHDIVETAELVREYNRDITELVALINRQCVLEREVSEDELKNDEQFGRLTTRITELRESVDRKISKLLQHPDADAFRRIKGT